PTVTVQERADGSAVGSSVKDRSSCGSVSTATSAVSRAGSTRVLAIRARTCPALSSDRTSSMCTSRTRAVARGPSSSWSTAERSRPVAGSSRTTRLRAPGGSQASAGSANNGCGLRASSTASPSRRASVTVPMPRIRRAGSKSTAHGSLASSSRRPRVETSVRRNVCASPGRPVAGLPAARAPNGPPRSASTARAVDVTSTTASSLTSSATAEASRDSAQPVNGACSAGGSPSQWGSAAMQTALLTKSSPLRGPRSVGMPREDRAQVRHVWACESWQVGGGMHEGDAVQFRSAAEGTLGRREGVEAVVQPRCRAGRRLVEDADAAVLAPRDLPERQAIDPDLDSGLLGQFAGRVLAQVTLGQHLALRRWLDRAAGELPAARRGGPRGHPADQEPSVVRRLGHRGEQGRQPHGGSGCPAQGVVAVRRPDPRQDDAVRLVAFQGRAADHRSVEQGGVGPDGRLPGVVHGPPVRRRQDGCRGLDQGQPVGVEELGAERLRHAPGSGLRDVTNDVHAGAVTVSTGPCGTLESRTGTTSVWASQTSRQSPPSPLLWLLLRQRAASGNASATSMQSPPVPLL